MYIYMVMGPCASGKTTTTKAMEPALKQQGCDVTTIHPRDLDALDAAVYKWVNTHTGDLDSLVIDGFTNTVFDRQVVIDTVKAAETEKNLDIKVIAVTHERAIHFCLTHNEDKEYRTRQKVAMLGSYHQYQNPLREEGIDAVYRITGDKRFDEGLFYARMNKDLHANFAAAVAEPPAEADEAVDAE